MKKPSRSDFTGKECEIIQGHRTPREVQGFLRSLPYNYEKRGETLRTFRMVVRTGTAHCLEAAISAAVIMEQHGYPPLLLDFESVDCLDHVLFLFQRGGKWGTVARSRDAGLHGRKPVFSTIRQLVMSYYETYVDFTGRIKGYGVADLSELKYCDWRLSARNVWAVERLLIDLPHTPIRISDRRYKRIRRRYVEFKRRHPKGQALYYANRHVWM